MLRLILLGLTLLTACMPVARACETPLVVSFNGDWEPYFYHYGKQRYDGTDYLLLQRIAEKLPCPVSVLSMSESRSKIEQEKGTFDIWLGATYTKERATDFFYSLPYREEVVGFALTSGNGMSTATTLEQVLSAGGLVGINTAGYFGETVEWLKARYPDQFIHGFALPDRLKLMINGKITAVVDDRLALCNKLNEVRAYDMIPASGSDIPSPGPVVLADEVLHSDKVHFMFSKKTIDQSLVDAFNTHLKGELARKPLRIPSQCMPKTQVARQ
ncbi:substrate-binding periplasmic protein [Alteromonas sp. CYL-A6]|uniref:substrate-binding periplasmic protein n=1 Tax=Alteromonas nitratireducens TaxID=3390813 RepID=UPI0034BC3060